MKTLHNVLRIILVDPPKEFDGMNDVEAFVEEKARNIEPSMIG